jgi:hypothetical protein
MTTETTTENSAAENSTETTTATATAATTADTTADTTSGSDTSTTASETDKVDLSKTDDNDTDDKTAGDDDDSADDKGELFGAPEEGTAYEISGLPEGMDVDAEMLTEAEPLLRELGVSNVGASKLAAVYANGIKRAVDGAGSALETSIAAQRTAWENEARAVIAGKDAEGKAIEPFKNEAGEALDFGGLDVKGVQRVSAKALDKLAPAGFREWLNETGLGLHPQMIAFAFKAGQAIAEDTTFETSTTGTTGAVRREDKYYPKK